MKKYILSIAILPAVFACKENRTLLDQQYIPLTDSSSTLINPNKPLKPAYTIGSGLTQEEIMDDSVFNDGSMPSSWEIAGITNVKSFKLFLKQLQSLILYDDKEQLSKLVRYPLRKNIKNENDFIKYYDRIFTNDAKISIANINFSQIFRNNKGVMTEGGRIWFSQEGEEFKIVAVNN